MVGDFSAKTAILLNHQFIRGIGFVFARHIILPFAGRADKPDHHSLPFSHINRLLVISSSGLDLHGLSAIRSCFDFVVKLTLSRIYADSIKYTRIFSGFPPIDLVMYFWSRVSFLRKVVSLPSLVFVI